MAVSFLLPYLEPESGTGQAGARMDRAGGKLVSAFPLPTSSPPLPLCGMTPFSMTLNSVALGVSAMQWEWHLSFTVWCYQVSFDLQALRSSYVRTDRVGGTHCCSENADYVHPDIPEPFLVSLQPPSPVFYCLKQEVRHQFPVPLGNFWVFWGGFGLCFYGLTEAYGGSHPG